MEIVAHPKKLEQSIQKHIERVSEIHAPQETWWRL